MSLWTAPARFSFDYNRAVLHSFCLILLKKHFNNNVIFITDTKGKQLATNMGWDYKEVIPLFNNTDLFSGKEEIWALGKLLSCLVMKEPFLHVDNDVLLLKPLAEELSKAPVITQSQDYDALYVSPIILDILRAIDVPPNLPKYNCGVMGGTDFKFWNNWAWNALVAAEKCSKIKKETPNHGTLLSMSVEQAFLGAYCESVGMKMTTVLEQPNLQEDAAKKGYVHFIGTKDSPKWIGAVERLFQATFPEEFKDFQERWKRV